MSPLNLEQVEEIFQTAIDLPPEQRADYLGKVCEDNGQMRSEVDALILAYEESGDFIERPAIEIDAAVVAGSLGGALIGQTISHYRIIERLGEGGMGVVYLAQDTKLGRRIALKLLPARFTIDAERVHRFEQEARAASALNHPNIVTIHEIGQLDASHFIATEFIEGVTLREHLGAGRLKVDEALAVAAQVASALTAAHAARIIHRDIKPENIMLRSDGYVKVLDFGLAKLTLPRTSGVDTEAQTKTPIHTDPGIVMGTVNYMSPEQSRGQEVDARTDIWSLGVLLYEMLVGSTPFKGETPSHVIVSLLEKVPLPLPGSADVPADLERIVGKALHKNRDERYQTARELHLDLQNLKQDREVEARLGRPIQGPQPVNDLPTDPSVRRHTNPEVNDLPESRRHWPGRRTSFVAIGVVALVAALALSYTYFSRHRSINSIAVRPFANESGNPDLEILSAGLADSLIESLSKVPGLEVKKGANSDARKVGQDLNVVAVLSGYLIKTGEDLTLRVELDSRKGNNLWRQTYHLKESSLVVLLSELGRDVVGQLSVPITDKTQDKVAKRDTDNSAAYLLYLSGVNHARKITEQDIRKAIDLFSQAIDKDPSYAKAYAAMSSARRSLTLCCDGHPSELVQAKAAAQKAVALDDELAEGHGALADSDYQYDWNWAEAEKEFQRALELDPNSSMSHFQYGDFLGWMGRLDEAKVHKGRALELEPFEPFFASRVGNSSRDPGKALEQVRYAISLDPNYYFSHIMAASVYGQRREYEKAIAEYQSAKHLSPDQTWSDVNLSRILVAAGTPEEARAILDQLLLRQKSRFVPPSHIAMVYTYLDDKEHALEWLEKAYDIHDPKLIMLNSQAWKKVENEPRFKDIKRRVGL
jgi:serine/threonine protein kinase/Tfp pilus assembly protein PilF